MNMYLKESAIIDGYRFYERSCEKLTWNFETQIKQKILDKIKIENETNKIWKIFHWKMSAEILNNQ